MPRLGTYTFRHFFVSMSLLSTFPSRLPDNTHKRYGRYGDNSSKNDSQLLCRWTCSTTPLTFLCVIISLFFFGFAHAYNKELPGDHSETHMWVWRFQWSRWPTCHLKLHNNRWRSCYLTWVTSNKSRSTQTSNVSLVTDYACLLSEYSHSVVHWLFTKTCAYGIECCLVVISSARLSRGLFPRESSVRYHGGY